MEEGVLSAPVTISPAASAPDAAKDARAQADHEDMVRRTNDVADRNRLERPEVRQTQDRASTGGFDGKPFVSYGSELVRDLSPEARDFIAAHETAHTTLGNRMLMAQGKYAEAELAADSFAARQPNFSVRGAREAIESNIDAIPGTEQNYTSNEDRITRMERIHREYLEEQGRSPRGPQQRSDTGAQELPPGIPPHLADQLGVIASSLNGHGQRGEERSESQLMAAKTVPARTRDVAVEFKLSARHTG